MAFCWWDHHYYGGFYTMYPRIFHLYGPLWVNGYGLMIALGALVFLFLTYRHPRRKKLLSSELYINSLLIGFLSAIVGGRLLFVLFELSAFDNFFEIFYPWVGGFSLFGSIIFVFISISIYLKSKSVPVFKFFDFIAVYVPLLQSFARIGCFLAGCCYGSPTTSFFSVTFTNVHSLAPRGIPIHPTQLYSSVASLIIFIFMLSIYKRAYKVTGVLFLSYLVLESFSRFMVEFWRGDRNLFLYSMTSMQVIVGGVFVIALILLSVRYMRWGR
jgi:phosphatidylglycerol:prolipoprotein diacylglycerol transferase